MQSKNQSHNHGITELDFEFDVQFTSVVSQFGWLDWTAISCELITKRWHLLVIRSDGNLILNDLVMQNSISEVCDSAKGCAFDFFKFSFNLILVYFCFIASVSWDVFALTHCLWPTLSHNQLLSCTLKIRLVRLLLLHCLTCLLGRGENNIMFLVQIIYNINMYSLVIWCS